MNWQRLEFVDWLLTAFLNDGLGWIRLELADWSVMAGHGWPCVVTGLGIALAKAGPCVGYLGCGWTHKVTQPSYI